MRALCSRRGTDPGTAHLCSLRSEEHSEEGDDEQQLFVVTKLNITEMSQTIQDHAKALTKVRRVLSV
jgi:hypothetical protein